MCDKAKIMATPILRKLISTPKAPKPVAPYNQAVLVDRTLYVSGVLGLDKATMELVRGGVKAEAREALTSLGHILEAGGSSYDNVVKVTILLKDIADFGAVNEIYAEYFTRYYPARCAYQAGSLPKNASIEIEAIAITGDVKTEVGPVMCKSCGPTCKCKM